MQTRHSLQARSRRRAPLTRTRVLDAALALMDAEGIASLSMRRVAAKLGVEAMSLYNHVDSKQALFTGLLDRAVEGFSVADGPHGDWRQRLRAWMCEARRLFAAHPALSQVVHSGVPLGAATLRVIDTLFAALQDAGFDAATQLRIWQLLRAYLFGTMAGEALSPPDLPVSDFIACCPHLVPVLPVAQCCDRQQLFEDGLDVLLDGIAGLPRVSAPQRP